MKVSVIIPCYNVEQYIEACIEALVQQTYPDLEMIAIDDGSQDNTVKVVEQLATKYPQLIFRQQSNAGGGAARNAGLDLATGEYVQFLDADDILAPTKIESQMAIATANPRASVIVGSYRRVKESGKEIFTRSYAKEHLESKWLMLMKTNLGITSANLFKMDFFRNGGRWDEQLKSSQEYDLMFRIMKAGNTIEFDSKILTTIVDRDSGSVSQVNRGENWKRYIELRSRMLEEIEKEGPAEDLDDATQVLFDAIRSLVPYDNNAAFAYYKRLIPAGFQPVASGATGTVYVKLFKVLGFKGAERVKKLLS